MANYASSVLVNAQAVLATKYNEAELRRKERPVLAMAVNNTPYCLPDHEALRVSESRTVEVKYLKKKAAGSATAKTALHTGNKGDSATLNLSWGTFVETFYTSRKQAQNNVIGFERMMQHEMEQAIANLKDRAETAALAALVAARCQLLAAGISTSGAGTWNDTNKALVIAAGNAAYFAQKAKQFMAGRLYTGMEFDVIADLQQYASFEQVQNQGAGNSTNTSFQFGGLNIARTQEVILSAYTAGSAIVMPSGSFAGLVWNDPENRKGVDSGMNEVGMLGTLLDPFGSGITFDVSHYTKRGDESANGGHAQDIIDQWEISLNIGWAVPPVTVANDSSIHLIAQG